MFKTSWFHFEYFKDWIFDLFPKLKIVYLNRLDVEAQAVSLAIAVLSGKWHARLADKGSKMPPEEIAKQFDLVSVCRQIKALNMQKTSWENFFFDRGLQPFRINYESLKFDLHSAVRQIASYIGYPDVDLTNLRSEFKATFDLSNKVWLNKIRNYRNGKFYANVLTEEERSKLSKFFGH